MRQDFSSITVNTKRMQLKGEFIRMVLGSDMTEEQKSEVIRCGISALSGEEI